MSKLPPCLRASSVIVGCNLKIPRIQPSVPKVETSCPNPLKCGLKIFEKPQGRPRATSSFFARHSHTDIKVPNFDAERPKSLQKPTAKSREAVIERQLITGMLAGTAITAALYVTKEIVYEHVMSMAPSQDVLAMAKIEIKLAEIPEGKTAVFKWRGKPLFIKHRSPADIEREENTDLSILRDPESDKDRCKKPEWLVVIGVCTHLGCVPTPNQGDYPGGMYCPCHGSHYDGSGRVRKGPAPTNLEVPQYEFPDDNTVLVG